MIQTIARGYRALFGATVKVILLLAACTALGAAIVYPLWYFATSAPSAYTVTMLIIIALALLLVVIRRVRAAGIMAVLRAFLRVAVVVAGIASCVALVLYGKRLLAIPVIIATIFLYGVISFGRDRR